MKEIKGDLLEIRGGAILHQVNARGITGGLAGALRRKWPDAFKRYLQACRSHNDPDGVLTFAGSCVTGCQINGGNRIIIAHIFGQIDPGPNTDMKLVDSALEDFASEYKAYGNELPVHAPFQMGCGLGGGDWSQYLPLLTKHIPDIIIVRKY